MGLMLHLHAEVRVWGLGMRSLDYHTFGKTPTKKKNLSTYDDFSTTA